jgi:hypothetical protein
MSTKNLIPRIKDHVPEQSVIMEVNSQHENLHSSISEEPESGSPGNIDEKYFNIDIHKTVSPIMNSVSNSQV